MRSCGLFRQTWKKEFARISKDKWANSPEPSGLCNVMMLYELEKDLKKNWHSWTLTITNVAGDTESSECKWVEKELMKPIRWLSLGPDYIKLPCDYIDWGKRTSMGDIFPIR